MSAHNFWNSFSFGFLNGMFNNNPFFGCGMGWNFFGFNNMSYPNCLFMVPNVMCSMNNFFPLLPNINMPIFQQPMMATNYMNIGMDTFTSTTRANSNSTTENSSTIITSSNAGKPHISTSASTSTSSSATTSNSASSSPARIETSSSTPTRRPETTHTPTRVEHHHNDTKLNAHNTGKISSKDNNKYNNLILKYAKQYNVNPNLIKAMIKQESGFNPNAKSKAGAIGLMQLMPRTATSLGVSNPYNPEDNIRGGVKYIRKILDKFDNNVELALAGYNAGPNAVHGKIPQNKETPKYVKNVMKFFREYEA